MDKAFVNAKRQLLAELQRPAEFDKSKKGGVDIAVADLCALLNSSPDFVTTSSCSGRIAISSENPGYAKQGTEWLLASHDVVDFARDVAPALARLSEHPSVLFKFEPFVLHVSCASLEAAKILLQVALQCGFKNSGIMLGKKTMVAVRSTLKLEVPLCYGGGVLVDEAYVRVLVEIANAKMAENFARIARFQAACAEALTSSSSSSGGTVSGQAASSTAADPTPSFSPPPEQKLVCVHCPELRFASRNQLFKHIGAVHRSSAPAEATPPT